MKPRSRIQHGRRFGRFDYERLGKVVAENVKEGAHIMVRAKFLHGIRFGFATAYKVLEP
jgi:hypothetical protein